MNTTLAQSSSQAILNNSSLPLFFHNSSTDDSTQPHSATDYGLNAGTLQHQSNHIPTLPAAIRLASAPTRRTNSRNGDPLNSPAPTIYVPDQQHTFSSFSNPSSIANWEPSTKNPATRLSNTTLTPRTLHYTLRKDSPEPARNSHKGHKCATPTPTTGPAAASRTPSGDSAGTPGAPARSPPPPRHRKTRTQQPTS